LNILKTPKFQKHPNEIFLFPRFANFPLHHCAPSDSRDSPLPFRPWQQYHRLQLANSAHMHHIYLFPAIFLSNGVERRSPQDSFSRFEAWKVSIFTSLCLQKHNLPILFCDPYFNNRIMESCAFRNKNRGVGAQRRFQITVQIPGDIIMHVPLLPNFGDRSRSHLFQLPDHWLFIGQGFFFFIKFLKRSTGFGLRNILKELKKFSGIRKNHECSICLDSFKENDDLVEFTCNKEHIFHEDCIKAWIEKRTNCPICRKEMFTNESDVIKDLDDFVGKIYDFEEWQKTVMWISFEAAGI